MHMAGETGTGPGDEDWSLEQQVGVLIRRVQQRHLAIFSEHVADLTPTQFSALVTVAQDGPISQNELGRRTAMDVATIKGVADRLQARALVVGHRDETDRRRILLEVTPEGRALAERRRADVSAISQATLGPLTAAERKTLVRLVKKIS